MGRRKAPLWELAEVESRILSDKDGLIVFNKPYDWPTSGHDLTDDDCVQYHLISYLLETGKITPTEKHPRGMVWAVHQLDADTSGVLLFTTRKNLVHHYHTLLAAPETEKIYLAVVAGSPRWNHHVEQTPVGRLPNGNWGTTPHGGNAAKSEFTVLTRHPTYTVLKVRLFTGRTHQIRLHLQHIGHPLLGEEWYAPEPCQRHYRQALHASSLSISAPALTFTAPVPEDLVTYI